MHSYNWDDLRIAHYVAQTGSLSGAAELLGVAHTTVLRRINAFEAQTGAQLFERTPQGYLVNHDRLKAFEAIAKAGKAIEEAQQEISKASVAPGEALRLTSTDTFCAYVLPEIVANIRKSDPDLKIALFSFNTHLNLAHGHVDLTVRPSLRLPDDMDGKSWPTWGSRSLPDPSVRPTGSDWPVRCPDRLRANGWKMKTKALLRRLTVLSFCAK